MRTEQAPTIQRQDYQAFPFRIPTVSLFLDLDPVATRVTSRLQLQRTEADAPLVLNGEDITLEQVRVNGQLLNAADYHLTSSTLTIPRLPAECELEIVSICYPEKNSTLMGLYVSNGVFFTQCEAEGFRRICWFADRPDVMSVYTVHLCAKADDYPLLLSNGNLMSKTEKPDGRHEAVWHDPFPKPSYLFAVVAGKLTSREKQVSTRSGRPVLLQVYSDPGSENQTEFALEALERALRWDEQRFGLELDLDRFMIVAARDFNMGAMENKGLNIFNAAYVLAQPETATDANYSAIEAVIGHEYFHNWTGNRVTCRDWFQLSLKEGLTVFRDQEFTADMMAQGLAPEAARSARTVKRIDDVIVLRSAQFPEDAGPMAHPIRPESYQEIGNFYTATVYEKGAEVIRMLHTLLGEADFQAGIREYFARHDGQAVTCDDFVLAMESAYQRHRPGKSLAQFRRWYQQAGTPRVTVRLLHDAQAKTCTVTLSQQTEPVGVERTQGVTDKPPLHIPFAIGLLRPDGQALPLQTRPDEAARDTYLLELTGQEQSWTFVNIEAQPVPSLLRDFTAPVNVEYDYTTEQLTLLARHDRNAFARWEACQRLATAEILQGVQARQAGTPATASAALVSAWRSLLEDPSLDAGYRARILALPTEKVLAEHLSAVDPLALARARDDIWRQLGLALAERWQHHVLGNQTPGTYSPDPLSAGKRALKNLSLSALMASAPDQHAAQALDQYQRANNMTDRLAALNLLVNFAPSASTDQALQDFYLNWKTDPLVIDKWFALQATARTSSVSTVKALM
ncbi:MAG: aminopeptidase N, partial [Pigmentiphaga sp.]|nr:aminopeptidase N [Pigmentiphaga sp.]